MASKHRLVMGRRRTRSSGSAGSLSAAGPAAARLDVDGLPPLDVSAPPWPGRRIAVGGAQIYARATPATSTDAEPALYVHGLGGSGTNWTDLAGLLAPRLDGVAIDLPGFGRSGPSPDGDYSIAAHTRIVVSYLESSGRGPAHLFGNSMGGAVAIWVAASRPDLVRTLTLVSPAVPDYRPSVRGDPRLALLLVPGVGLRVAGRLARTPAEQRVRGVLELCFADPSRTSRQRFEEAVAEAQNRTGMQWAATAMVGSLRSIAGSYLRAGTRGPWARMADIAAPTLVIWGDRDRLVDVRVAPRVATTIANARLLVLPGVGHVAQMEDPVSCAAAVTALIADSANGAVRAPAGENLGLGMGR
jgi:pimeloyl-ACP methyl ester carboxylesterase